MNGEPLVLQVTVTLTEEQLQQVADRVVAQVARILAPRSQTRYGSHYFAAPVKRGTEQGGLEKHVARLDFASKQIQEARRAIQRS